MAKRQLCSLTFSQYHIKKKKVSAEGRRRRRSLEHHQLFIRYPNGGSREKPWKLSGTWKDES